MRSIAVIQSGSIPYKWQNWPQSYEKYKNLCSQACKYKSFWKTLVFTSFVKFNPIMPVLTCKYKLLKFTKLKNSSIEIKSTLNQICKSFTQALWLVKSSFLAQRFPIWFASLLVLIHLYIQVFLTCTKSL